MNITIDDEELRKRIEASIIQQFNDRLLQYKTGEKIKEAIEARMTELIDEEVKALVGLRTRIQEQVDKELKARVKARVERQLRLLDKEEN